MRGLKAPKVVAIGGWERVERARGGGFGQNWTPRRGRVLGSRRAVGVRRQRSATFEACNDLGRTLDRPALEVGQGEFAALAAGLAFAQEDRQGTEQAEIARGGVMSDLATILVLSAVATVMLSVLDAPVVAGQGQQAVGIGLLGVEAGDGVVAFGGVPGDHASTQFLTMTIDADDLGDGGKTEGLWIGVQDPKATLLHAAVFLVQRAGLRGEYRCRGPVWLWRTR